MHVYFQELCSKKRSEKTVVYDAFCGGLADASRGGPVVDAASTGSSMTVAHASF
jgi:hypothetical protein